MIITSLLDTDLYKFSMMQVVLHHFPAAQVEYRYKCRNQGVDLRPYLDEIRQEIHALCQLRFTSEELDYLRGLRFIKSDFVDFLGLFHLPERCIAIEEGREPGEISITVKGPWLHTILFEIPVLAIVNEVYFRNVQTHPDWEEGRQRLQSKMHLVLDDPALTDFRVAEYGTRRRFSKRWHEEVVATMKAEMGQHFAGTSNVLLAMRHNVLPLGTMGARVSPGLPGPGAAPARLPGLRLGSLGQRVPGRPRHCAFRCVWHRRLSARFRYVFLQALRWRAP